MHRMEKTALLEEGVSICVIQEQCKMASGNEILGQFHLNTNKTNKTKVITAIKYTPLAFQSSSIRAKNKNKK